jgi:hypothetical protein
MNDPAAPTVMPVTARQFRRECQSAARQVNELRVVRWGYAFGGGGSGAVRRDCGAIILIIPALAFVTCGCGAVTALVATKVIVHPTIASQQ